MKIVQHNLADVKGRKEFREFVGNYILDSLQTSLGTGFTSHKRHTIDPHFAITKQIWREVRLPPERLDQLDNAISAIRDDIVSNGARNFLEQIPSGVELVDSNQTIMTKNGISIRVALTLFPPPAMLVIDWIAWP